MAVFTNVTPDMVSDLLETYDIGTSVTCVGIAEGVENSNFRLMTTVGSYILTLYEKRVDPTDLPFFLGLMDHLSRLKIPCPVPIATRSGTYISVCGGRPAAIVSFIPGQWPRHPSPFHCAQVGATLAELHKAGASYEHKRVNALSLASWRRLMTDCADQVDREIIKEVAQDLADLEAQWPNQLPVGLIHGDLFPDNVLFEGQTLSGLIDFYFSCTDFLMYDTSICLNAWCFDDSGRFDSVKGSAFLNAYEHVRPVTPQEKEVFPILCRGSAMRFFLTRLYDMVHTPETALVTPKDPMPYLQRLRLHRSMSDYHAYGLV